ncbi:hypothetical protein GOP47_0030238 [Adiantum capillus-veneris]|nr:hypothetical protein GOP47_0030238 [Adiantum capillus-veneris]
MQAMQGVALYEVGGTMGWTNFNVRTNRLPNYDLWSSDHQPFYPGDQFVFQYTPNFHTIHQFPNKVDYERCDFTSAIQLDAGQTGTFLWVASDAGTFYFGCKTPVEGLGYHCNGGQKLSITILKWKWRRRKRGSGRMFRGGPSVPRRNQEADIMPQKSYSLVDLTRKIEDHSSPCLLTTESLHNKEGCWRVSRTRTAMEEQQSCGGQKH